MTSAGNATFTLSYKCIILLYLTYNIFHILITILTVSHIYQRQWWWKVHVLKHSSCTFICNPYKYILMKLTIETDQQSVLCNEVNLSILSRYQGHNDGYPVTCNTSNPSILVQRTSPWHSLTRRLHDHISGLEALDNIHCHTMVSNVCIFSNYYARYRQTTLRFYFTMSISQIKYIVLVTHIVKA